MAEFLSHTTILGVRVHNVTLREALDHIAQFVATGQPHQIATVNPEFIMTAQDNPAFRAVLNQAALCVPDGIGLIWAARWLGLPLRERVAGVELTEQIAARAAQAGWRIFLLGAAPGVAARTAAIWQERYPGLDVAGVYAGSPADSENESIVEMIRAAQTDVLCVAYGAPAQDLWIARNLARLNVKVALGVGGSFDFISGVARRAPRWVQRLGLEWLHRLMREPWRWRRQLALPRFVGRVLYSSWPVWLMPLLLFSGVLALYIFTLAPGSVPGDPSEYIFVPRILGIAHPPGYAFYTLLAWLWQNLVPIGTLAYRTNLLAATAGALMAVLVYGIVGAFVDQSPPPDTQPATQGTYSVLRSMPALFGALAAATAVDMWQHSLHANAHIVSALLATLMLFLLTRWAASGLDGWLYCFALVAGLSVTQHPLLVFGFPAFALFIWAQWYAARLKWNTGLNKVAVLFALFALGLSVWLYIPLRGPYAPFNRNAGTLAAFWQYITAQGLRVNLFAFGLADQPVRLNVLGQLLALQYAPLTLLLAAWGGGSMARRQPRWLAMLILFFSIYSVFIINTIQDVMAYLMLPFIAGAVLAGLGAQAVIQKCAPFGWAAALGLLLIPAYTVWHNAPRVSLREYNAGQEWVDAVGTRFAGKGEKAVLLAPWEWMTPLWVAEAEGRRIDPADVRPVYVAATSANPFLDNVLAHWGQGPVYLADFRRGVWEGGLFRLRPAGEMWQVVAPGDPSIPAWLDALAVMAEDQVELVGCHLDQRALSAGQTAHLALAMRAPITPTHYLMPFAWLGERAYRWTTDSHVLSTEWRPGEVIIEQYDLTIPLGTPPGRYPLRVGMADLSAGRDLTISGTTLIHLGEITVTASTAAPPAALANFDSRVALTGARMCRPAQCSAAPNAELVSQPGQTLTVWLDWRVLQQITRSYKAFVHLITPANGLVAQGDYYTPLGGAFPSALWIPRWIEGQTFTDPYFLNVPADLAPGDYLLEIGLYGLTDLRRAPLFDAAGHLAGDRVIVGTVHVRPPGN